MTAVTSVTIIKRSPLGGTARHVIADVTFSNSYATGGDTFTAAQFGLTTVNYISPTIAFGSASTAYAVLPDLTGLKLKLHGMGASAATTVALTETTTTDQHLTVARLIVIGDAPYV
jgi:hypothetical protein